MLHIHGSFFELFMLFLAMKNKTLAEHRRLCNDLLFRFYRDLSSPLSLRELIAEEGFSYAHFHRFFKAETGRNLALALRQIRLQKAASLLLTNRGSTIGEVAAACGFASHQVFNRVFWGRFGMSPSVWRQGGFEFYAAQIMQTSEAASRSQADFSALEPKLIKLPPRHAYYLRHRGYNRGIAKTWERLLAWAIDRNLPSGLPQIGLHHDNPVITPLSECGYVAAIEVQSPVANPGSLGYFEIPGGLYAVFEATGVYGDVLRLMRRVYHGWLPASGYEAKALPAYALYRRNHFVDPDGYFDLSFHVPVSVL
ncbi:MAG: GyrI-like domain-containing protein [Campylobacterales bacterium]